MQIKATINQNILRDNINKFKNSYNYRYNILAVSNDAFYHGMFLINYLNDEFDYLYTCNFKDISKIRKYNHDIKIIYSGYLTIDNIYDLIMNNVIILIKSEEEINFLLDQKIKDNYEIILDIDINDFNGFNSLKNILNITNLIKEDKHLKLIGLKAIVNNEITLEFEDIINHLENLKLIILNNENYKQKIAMSNAIILDNSIYGIENASKGLFKKEKNTTRPILQISAPISKIITIKKKKKESYIAVINFGLNHGMLNNIKKVFINDSYYNIKEINDEYTLIDVDDTISINDEVEIIGTNMPLNSKNDLCFVTSYLTINYEENINKEYVTL